MQHSQEEIFSHIKKVLIELFEIEESTIKGDAKLYEDLDIDSIDIVDLLIELKKFTGADVSPLEFAEAVTIDDVVNVISKQ